MTWCGLRIANRSEHPGYLPQATPILRSRSKCRERFRSNQTQSSGGNPICLGQTDARADQHPLAGVDRMKRTISNPKHKLTFLRSNNYERIHSSTFSTRRKRKCVPRASASSTLSNASLGHYPPIVRHYQPDTISKDVRIGDVDLEISKTRDTNERTVRAHVGHRWETSPVDCDRRGQAPEVSAA